MKIKRIYSVIIFCAVFLLYAKTIGFDFSYFDDTQILVDKQAYFETKDIQRLFTTDPYLGNSTNYYRPIQSMSYLCDVLISGGIHAWMFHLTNIILFGMICCVLFLILLKFNVYGKFAFIGTLIFCVHPVFVTAVAWIPARGDLLLTLFSLLSMFCFIEFTIKSEIKYILLVWFTFTLALFCKETATVLPLLFLIYFLLVAPNCKVTWHHVLLGLLIGLSGFIWLYLRKLYTSPGEQITLINFLTNLLSIPVAFSRIVILPIDFSPLPSFTTSKIVVGLFVMALLIFLVIQKSKRTGRELLFYFLWFLILLLPNFLGVKLAKIDYIEHRFLIPLIGILLLVLSLLPPSIKGDEKMLFSWKKDLIWIGAVMVLWFVSFYKAEVYRDPESYYGTVIKYSPYNRSLAYNNRGLWKHQTGNTEGALEDYNHAMKLDSLNAGNYINRGLLTDNMEDFEGALDDYNRSIMLDKEQSNAYNNRGILKSRTGDYIGALEDLDIAISYDSINGYAYFNRGLVNAQIGNYTDAMDDFNRAIFYQKIDPSFYLYRGLLKMQLEDAIGAMNDFNQAIIYDKNNVLAYFNRGLLKMQNRDLMGAKFDFDQAITLNNNFIDALYNRAILHLELGESESALHDCETLLEIDPNNEDFISLKNLILKK